MIRTKFSATVTNTGQGLEVTSSDIGNLYILIKDKSELERVGELCSKPDLDKERLIFIVADLENIEILD